MSKCRSVFMICGTVLGMALNVSAAEDIDLKLNGDFRGAAQGAATAPGWSCDTADGVSRILNGKEWDEFILELSAPSNKAKRVLSDALPVMGRILEVEADLQGKGSASIGFVALNGAQQPIATAGQQQTYPLAASSIEVKSRFSLTNPEVKFIRIFLAAEAGSVVRFGDVSAEFKQLDRMAPAPVSMAAPASTPVSTPQIDHTISRIPAVANFPPLINDHYYSFTSLARVEEFQVNLPVGSDIDFELGEDVDARRYWVLFPSYNPNICRVKLEHDRDGFWPFRRDKAEIELKAVSRGTTKVEFQCAEKRVIIHFTAL